MSMLNVMRIVGLLLLWLCGAIADGYLPSSIQRCQLNDEVCFRTQAQNYLSYHKYGITEHNVPGIEPLQIGTLRSQIGGEDSPMQINLLLTNASIHNFGSMTVKSLKIIASPTDLTKPVKAIMILSSPSLKVIANYQLNGKFLILPIKSKGKAIIKLNQVEVTTRIDFQPEKRSDGYFHFKIVGYKMTETVGSGHFHLTNLFNDPALSESTLKVFNDEWETFAKELGPKIMEASTRATRAILQKLFDLIPFDDFFTNK